MRSLARQKRSQYLRQQQYSPGGGVRFGGETTTFVSADAKIRPLRDQMIVEPLEVEHSKTLFVQHSTKPVRGIVRAIGPGAYPKIYDHPDKSKRKWMKESKHFLPTEVKVGQTVELGGSELNGYAFQTFYHGDKVMLICREPDVCGIVDG